jgi:hypothetical protein
MTTNDLRELEPLMNRIEEIFEKTGKNIAEAITVTAVPGKDATGGNISCVTEAIMGVTSGLVAVANSIQDLAKAVRSHKPPKKGKST